MVTAVYKPVVNGVTNMVALYKRRLEELGHTVTIFTLGEPDPAGEEPGVVRSRALPLNYRGYHFSMTFEPHVQERLRQMDVLHCHHLAAGVDLAHRYANCPIVLTNHTRFDLYMGTYLSVPMPAAEVIMRQAWPEYTSLADLVIAPSESMRRLLVEFGVLQPIEVIPNGVDLRPFRHPERPYNKADLGIDAAATLAMFTGRLAEEKKIDSLLEQFAIAHSLVPDLHLALVAAGPEESHLRQLAQTLGCAAQIHFLGAFDYREVPNLLAAADFFVTASVSEVHPLTLIEAMAAGLPIAATRTPGIIDSVEQGRTGLLVEDPDRGLAAAITALAIHPGLRQQMGQAARQDSERFDIQLTVGKTVELYERLRVQRPDLQRAQPHGRWYYHGRGVRSRLDQLARVLNSANSNPAS
ncbi:MAG: glycosyltransferase [Candidatus Promineifilaceae bacterium]